ncbi:MAG TPA: alpha/beta hydrolase [Blastocatellia bacterium]|nr:alpha/beta hydrolase [Blastocatellia bacterium]
MKPIFRLAAVLLMAGMSSLAFGQALQDQFFDSNGVRIRYVEEGVGEPVVLVHGYGSSAERNWINRGPFHQLAKNYRVIALDCRGHGKSAKPHEVKQYGQEMFLDIVRLLDHLKIRKAHIVGYSMGGRITAKLLTMKPERFLTATLGGSAGTMSWTAEDDARNEKEAQDIEQGDYRSVILRTWPTGKPKPTEVEIEAEIKRRTDANPDLDRAALAAVRRASRDQLVTESQMANVKVPTIAIVGTADPNIDNVNKLKKVMPQLKVVTINGATHNNAAGYPEFLQALQEFLRSNSVKK